MQIDIVRATLGDRPLLRQLSEFYMYDLSEYDAELEINAHGTFDFSIDRYWQDINRAPYLVQVDGKAAGFVLVKRGAYLSADPTMMDMSDFFILRRFRRQGVGTYAAETIFNMFPGKWEVRQFAENTAAQSFWRKVISRYTNGHFQEFALDNEQWKGAVQYFENAAP
jgi:predicted acetyltransferase